MLLRTRVRKRHLTHQILTSQAKTWRNPVFRKAGGTLDAPEPDNDKNEKQEEDE